MRTILTAIALFLALSVSCSGKTQTEGPDGSSTAIEWSQAALNAAGIKAGDVIKIKSGTYSDVRVSLTLNGTADKPIIIKADQPGKVILTGNSSISIAGSYITVSGFHFKDCEVATSNALFNFRVSSSSHAYDSRLTDCVFSGTGKPMNKELDNKWVSVYGQRNEVDRCSFIDKRMIGSLLVVWIEKTRPALHKLHDNYFTHPFSLKDDSGGAINGQEMIRIGTSDVSMSTSQCRVWGNYFYRCNGEMETISNKSCDNVYYNNLFDENEGCLTLRHGNACIVDGNYFLGKGVARTPGVRVIGERHKIYNNYFESLRGEDQRAAIALIRGKENSALNEYFQIIGAEVCFNTMVDCTNGIVANTAVATSTMPVIETTIANNVIATTNTSHKGIVLVTTHSPDITWENNYVFKASVTAVSEGVTKWQDFTLLQKGSAKAVIPGGSNAYTKETGFSYVTTDASASVRPAAKTPGASEPDGTGTRTMPTRQTAGSTWTPNL